MKVLLVTGSYPPARCGVGDYAERLASALMRQPSMEVAVLTSTTSASAARDRPVIMRDMPTWHRRGLARFRDVLRRTRPDLVHIQFPTQGYDAWSGLAGIALLSRLKRIPVVVTLHEHLPRTTFRADRSIYALAFAANVIVVVRPGYYESHRWPWKIALARSKIRLIENASALPVVDLNAEERQATKLRLGRPGSKLVAFFGFSYPHKGVDLLFEIADPAQHHILLIGELEDGNPYHDRLRSLAASSAWQGKVTLTGFVQPDIAARLLATADAAVFPYRDGGGIWNSSLHAAASQGTFAIATSLDRQGYDAATNIYYARPDDVEAMRHALLAYQGTRRPHVMSFDAWSRIAEQHQRIYLALVSRKPSA